MNQEKVNNFAAFVETLHDVDLDKDNIREFFTAIPFATCKLMNKFAAEKKREFDIIERLMVHMHRSLFWLEIAKYKFLREIRKHFRL